MEHTPKRIRFGNLEIPSPCEVPWEEMDAHSGKNRVCRRCNKVVHDLTGLTESEIERLFVVNGGQLCGNVSLDFEGNPLYLKDNPKKSKYAFLKHTAAAASFLLLYPTPQGKSSTGLPTSIERTLYPDGGGKTAPTEKTNTLISGVILTESEEEIEDSLLVTISFGGKKIASDFATYGLFSFELDQVLKPTDEIKIIVSGRTFDPGMMYRERKYGSAVLQLPLGKAQNVQLKVAFTPPTSPPRKFGGMMRRPND